MDYPTCPQKPHQAKAGGLALAGLGPEAAPDADPGMVAKHHLGGMFRHPDVIIIKTIN